MISQIIKLCNHDAFTVNKKKYGLKVRVYDGLFGLEIRGVKKVIKDQLIKCNEIDPGSIYSIDSMLFLTGSIPQLKRGAEYIDGILPADSKSDVRNSINNFEKYCSHSYTFGEKILDFKNSFVMGILNVTPDSFSDGGNYFDSDSAANYGLKMLQQGADIVDIGGESSRPGSDPVSAQEEIKRIIPVIEKILDENENALISVDTTKEKVAEEALKCGAKLVNDISGGTFEPEIFNIAMDYDAGFVIMHMKGKPKTMQQKPEYENLVVEIYDFLEAQSSKACEAGLEKIFLDPGIGFGKSSIDNFRLLDRLEDFKSLSYPLLIGLSRKSFIGKFLNLDIDERDEASSALNLFAIEKGARIIRTHNVKMGVQICKLMNEISLA